MRLNRFASAVLFGCLGSIVGAATAPAPDVGKQIGESVVFTGTEPAKLAFQLIKKMPTEVRSTYLPGLPHTMRYKLGRDYAIGQDGQLQRVPNSRIPDFRQSAVFGLDSFDHFEFPEYGNKRFFAYVDYSHTGQWAARPPRNGLGSEALANVQTKLATGKKIRVVAFGDSVTQGAESSSAALTYWARWVQQLRTKYPLASIEAVNSGTGGDSSKKGLERLDANVVAHRPDLVLIAFGLNDINQEPKKDEVGKWAARKAKWARSWAKYRKLPPPAQTPRIEYFAKNLRAMVERVKKETGADVILVSALTPNPKWKFSLGDMAGHAAATERVAKETNSAYADVFNTWEDIAGRKQPEDMLANNANHPNDFGHWVYFQALAAIGL